MRIAIIAILGIALVGLYCGCVFYMIFVIQQTCVFGVKCVPSTPIEFGKGLTTTISIIGGLVSAAVVAQLGATPPGDTPTIANLDPQSKTTQNLIGFLTLLFFAVWVLTGLSALVVGVVVFSDVNSTLAELGTTWLGAAVTALYAYLGIKPPPPKAAPEKAVAAAKA